MRGKLIIS